jgi:hypothetical protein
MEWIANARANGSGPATLHVAFYPIDPNGALGKLTASWTINFTVAATGPINWSDQPNQSSPLATACAGDAQGSVQIEGSISVNGATAISAKPTVVSCNIIT